MHAYKRALRIVWGLGQRESCREHFRTDGILTLPCLLIYHLLIHIYKNQNQFKKQEHDYVTRFKNNLQTEKFKLSKFKRILFYYGPKFFNSAWKFKQ